MNKMDIKIADNMSKYGGSFVKALGECFRRADVINRAKLREAFPGEFQTYHPSQWVKKGKNENQS